MEKGEKRQFRVAVPWGTQVLHLRVLILRAKFLPKKIKGSRAALLADGIMVQSDFVKGLHCQPNGGFFEWGHPQIIQY